jgi:hypothetical protein
VWNGTSDNLEGGRWRLFEVIGAEAGKVRIAIRLIKAPALAAEGNRGAARRLSCVRLGRMLGSAYPPRRLILHYA